MEKLIHANEKTYYTICLVISIIMYLSLIISVIGIVYILIGILITVILHGLALAQIRSNGVKISEYQFPNINKKVQEISAKMGIRDIPDVFIIQSDGLLNAFATRFFGRNFIVLYSEIVEITKDKHDDELNFIIAHELAHIQRNHITKNSLILPAMWIPFLGNAYSRACEYTCDRFATAYIGNAKASVNALLILAVGKTLFMDVNVEDFKINHKRETGFFIWLNDILSTHPPLPLRIKEVEYFNEFPEYFGFQTVYKNKKSITITES
ncbi:M48 family metallopeptidase [Schinkia azotoformans]|uniref:M48 family metallopeptidase n=1 Tax=Schinkia azotoformans TaxID=1454 RepID=UPI002DB95EEE|nr:M48 family metallopeptidase [Schinkia azotoformans]MEC1719130.1 M48 family metallopeptidase [Schinkia azotoformans]MED4354370.1 M48 family metallopeptidase [Schinkia azotoformans]MED4413822.1 M48 family metallopeptidase [Schinkia azotoformans]